MTKTKKAVIGVVVLVGAAALMFVMQPAPVHVEVATIATQPFVLTVEDQGRSRAYKPYIVAAPIGGRLLRTSLDEGDRVREGDPIAHIALQPQDQRVVATERANIEAALAQLHAEQARMVEAETTLERAERELNRRQTLVAKRLASIEEVETYQQAVNIARAGVDSGAASVAAATANVASARARLLNSEGDSTSQTDNGAANVEVILAPTNGTVLKVLEENERVILPGTELFQISNQDSIEVVVDLLTQDAVSITAGDDVDITGWGGDFVIKGRVRYIEPEAFTKFSALGVEEQRVNVIIDLLDPPANLGAEYRVEVAIVVWESESELTVPTSSLFQRNDGWNVFAIVEQKVELRAVEIGNRNKEFAQINSGLNAGDVVVQYPSDLIQEGIEVTYD